MARPRCTTSREAVKIIHFTDPHLTVPGERLFGFDPWERLDACLADIAAYHSDADFCVVTGDLAGSGYIAAYEALKERLSRFPLETRLLLGNCDGRAQFLQVFGGADPSGFVQGERVDGPGRFLFLDTLDGSDTIAGLYCATRSDWLRHRLALAKGAPVYIFMHHPPFDIGHAAMDRIKLAEADAFLELLSGHAVKHIFFGHTHRPVSGTHRGIGFSGQPGLNFQIPLSAASVATEFSDEPPMYGVVRVSRDGVTVNSDAFLHRRPAGSWPK
jgi:3',5'-cyclic-AMP phosphodiesterase